MIDLPVDNDWTGGPDYQSKVVVFTGTCPSCQHLVEDSLTGRTLVTATAERPDAGLLSAPSIFRCNCHGHDHEGRPQNEQQGCGASWFARPYLVEEGREDYKLEPVTEPAVLADVVLVDAEDQKNQDGYRELVAKWIPGITAVTGTLGLATVVLSQDSVKTLDQSWRIGAFGAVAMAVLLAALAIMLIYRTAYGLPKSVPNQSPEDLRKNAARIRNRLSKVTARLRLAIVCAIAALIAMVTALGIFWIQPSTTLSISVSYADTANGGAHTTVCGKFVEAANATLRVSVTDGPRSTTESIPLSDVITIQQASTCKG